MMEGYRRSNRDNFERDFIILGGVEDLPDPWFCGDRELVERLRFRSRYELPSQRVPFPGGKRGVRFHFFFYQRVH